MEFKKHIPVILILFLFGCATTSPEVKVQTAEDIKPISVSEFTLGPGDKIDISVWRHNDLSKNVQIDPYGKIHYPFVGEINASGISIHKLRDILEKGLSEYYVDPVVNVNVTSVQSQKIFVLGEVSRPGIFSLYKPTSVLEVIAQSNGFTHDAKEENVLVIRGNKDAPELIKLNLKLAMKKGDLRQNISLQSGDIVYVPATHIANMSRYFEHLYKILRPVVLLETGIILEPQVEDVFEGTAGKDERKIIIINQD